jgi:diguanylate cyclase (GGDEF)-like protein/PAS domain S-box-containing protein
MYRLSDPEILREVLEELSTGVYIVDPERRILFWNQGAEKISGFLSQDVVGRCCGEKILAHCDENSKILCGDGCPLLETMRDGRRRTADVYLRHKAGHRVAVHLEANPIRNEQGTLIGVAESFFERRYVPQPDRRLNNVPAGDKATGLPDKNMVETQLRQCLSEFEEHGVPFCVFQLHVDRLEELRNSRGHDAVDSILRVVSETLRNLLRPTDVIGQWLDGDFLAIARNCQFNVIGKIARRLEKIASRSEILWWGDVISATISVGATSVLPGDSMESLLDRAQRALCASVQDGGDRITILPDTAQ